MTRLTQQALMFPRDHDLPPKWDGYRVEWDGWRQQLQGVFICPPPKPDRCAACGSNAEPSVNTGRVYSDHQGVAMIGRGNLYDPTRAPLLVLQAFRCPDCRHDTVLEVDTGTEWDLDESDYHDQGSTAP